MSSAFDWTIQRILLVDHDEQFRFFTRSLFRHHKVREVQSVALVTEMPRVLAHHEIHVAFVELPHEDAGVLHMLRWLRHDKGSPAPRLPVILLVKTLDRAQLARASAFGIHGILQKPVSGEQMLKAVIGVATAPRLFKSAGEPAAAVVRVKTPARAASPGTIPEPRPAEKKTAGAGFVRPVGRAAPETAVPGGAGGKGAAGGEAAATAPGASAPIEVAENGPSTGGRQWPDDPVSVPEKSQPLEIAAPAADKKKKTEAISPVETAPAKSGKEKQAAAGIDEILEAHARWVESGGRDGRRANLEGRELGGLALGGKVLTSAMLRRVDLSGSDFTGADMHGVDLRNADIFGGTFVGANLAVARMRHAKLRGCVFSGASLKGADLGGADLTGATFDEADLTGAILVGTNLAEADLSQAAGLIQGQLDGVAGDAATRLPPGLILPEGND